MDTFTNFIISNLLTIGIWAIGATYIRFTSNDTSDYIAWLKIWALTGLMMVFVISLLLSFFFPDPMTAELVEKLIPS